MPFATDFEPSPSVCRNNVRVSQALISKYSKKIGIRPETIVSLHQRTKIAK